MHKILKFYNRHRKLCLTLVNALVAAVIFIAPDVAAAQADPETTKLMDSVNELINYILKFSSALLWPVLLMIGSLLDNELIFGGAMGERLLGIWVQIRNIVNIAFVLVLLAVAVYNVLGIGEEGGPFALKQVLPKFVLALIAVNFSFLAIKVVLDFTNVITGAVFALPATASDAEFKREQIEDMICGTTSEEMPMKNLLCDEKKFNDRAKSIFSRLDRTNVALVYAIKFGNAPQMKFIKDGLKDLGQLGFNVLFNMVLYVVYALSFIALFLVLLSRVVAMWIAVVLSPLLALSIVVPQLKELGGGAGELQQKFVKGAIAPITIGLVLSVGYIMLDGFSADKSIHGTLLSSSTLSAIDPNSLPTGITDLQQLMVAVGIVVIVWTGVFGAAKDTVAGTVTEMIRSKALDFGKWTAKLPTFLQAIPTGGKFGRKSMTLAELGATILDIPGKMRLARGRSLFETAPASEADLQPWRDARLNPNMENLAKALAQSAHALKDAQGWDLFKETVTGAKKINEEQFKKDYGTGPNDYDKAVRKISEDGNLMDRIKTFNGEIKDYSSLRAAAERKPLEAITDAASAAKALRERSAGAIFEDKAFGDKNQWTRGDIEGFQRNLQKIPETIHADLLKFDSAKQEVSLAPGLDHKAITAMAVLVTDLKSSKDEAGIDAALDKARVLVQPQFMKRIVADSAYQNETLKNHAVAKSNPAEAAQTPSRPSAISPL